MIIWNGIIDSHLPFLSGKQQYFQNQSRYVYTILHRVPSNSVLLIFSQMAISLMPASHKYNLVKSYQENWQTFHVAENIWQKQNPF